LVISASSLPPASDAAPFSSGPPALTLDPWIAGAVQSSLVLRMLHYFDLALGRPTGTEGALQNSR
jgi:hypothetical protein